MANGKKICVVLCVIILILLITCIDSKSQKNPYGPALTSYLVKKGDTLWNLFGVDWYIVARLNRVSPYSLYAGDIIMMPLDMEIASRYSPFLINFPELKGEKVIYIDLSLQALAMYEGKLQKWMPISSGEAGHNTPTGRFRVLQKEWDYYSKSYPEPDGGAHMPFALRFYGPYWIHGGELPGKPASKGCVRLMPKDAKKLYLWANTTTLVVVK